MFLNEVFISPKFSLSASVLLFFPCWYNRIPEAWEYAKNFFFNASSGSGDVRDEALVKVFGCPVMWGRSSDGEAEQACVSSGFSC